MATASPTRRNRLTLAEEESALRDAQAALTYAATPEDREWIEAQIASIRGRLPHRGANVDQADRRGLRHVEAAPDHRDPPNTLRFVVLDRDGERRPKGARIAGAGILTEPFD